MRRDQLEHLIRAASFITKEKDFIVLGSQSILGTVPDAPRLTPKLTRSVEADIGMVFMRMELNRRQRFFRRAGRAGW